MKSEENEAIKVEGASSRVQGSSFQSDNSYGESELSQENNGDEPYKGFNAHTVPDTLEGPYIMDAIEQASHFKKDFTE